MATAVVVTRDGNCSGDCVTAAAAAVTARDGSGGNGGSGCDCAMNAAVATA
jgi:hypothetical protein